MSKLITLISQAISVIFGYKQTTTTLREEITVLAAENADLKRQLVGIRDEDAANDAELEAKFVAQKERADALFEEISALESKSEELAQALTDNDKTPSVDSDFRLTDSVDPETEGLPTESNS